MRFKDVFSIIGPGMVGPSSSHTAGAVRIGRVARQLFGALPEKAEVKLYRSFAETYRGHGTDVALAAGLLDWDTDDERIPEALSHAEQLGVQIDFCPSAVQSEHPNMAKITMTGNGRSMSVVGASIGGGNIRILGIDGFDVIFGATRPALMVRHVDRIGLLAEVTRICSEYLLNIAAMVVDRKARCGEAMLVLETDTGISREALAAIEALPDVLEIRVVDLD